jgi:hypothetical protein
MSRSGYSDDCENLELYRQAVTRAIKGRRGQALLRDLAAALDAMQDKRLFTEELVQADGEFCALGVLGAARGMDMSRIDAWEPSDVARAFGVARSLAAEIVYENDEHDDYEWVTVEVCGPMRPHWPDYGKHERSRNLPVGDGPERRWKRMRAWVAKHIEKDPS